MYYKIIEFTTTIKTHKKFTNLNDRLRTPKRIEANKKLFCTIKGCHNKKDSFGAVCYEHRKLKQITGTYTNNTFSFINQVSKPSKELYKSGYTTPTLKGLATSIERLYSNPYTHHIEVIKGAWHSSSSSSKEKIVKYIRENKPKRMNTHYLSIRLGIVFKLYLEGVIEAGSQLRFALSKAILPHTDDFSQGAAIKEVIGNIVLKNFYKELDIIANELILL
jgi:hypothetical protein